MRAILSATLIPALLFAMNVHADSTSDTQQPLDQAIKSVDRNLEKDPENPGLNRASEQLRMNQEMIGSPRPVTTERGYRPEQVERAHRSTGFERPQTFNRVERPQRPERGGRR